MKVQGASGSVPAEAAHLASLSIPWACLLQEALLDIASPSGASAGETLSVLPAGLACFSGLAVSQTSALSLQLDSTQLEDSVPILHF